MGRLTIAERRSKPAAAAISHPLRVRILVVLSHGPISPKEFVDRDLAKGYYEGKRELSQVAYHFRELAGAGCIEVADTRQVRGAVEHIYRLTSTAYHSDEEWASLDPSQRKAITRVTWQTLMAEVESSIIADAFDGRDDRHLSWQPLEVDEQGWQDLRAAQREALERTEEIAVEAAQRLAADGKGKSFRATAANLAFPSPPAPPAP